jgi:hypothetical protein
VTPRYTAPLALLLTVSGCSNGCGGGRARDAGVRPAVVARDAGAPDAGAARLDEGAVRVVLDAWVRAQNEGDFARYQSLYAARFSGVKRAGPRARAFDRAQWLVDRRAMFAAAQRVSVRDVSLDLGANTALVRFTQDYAAGEFHDVGTKHLALVAEGPAIRIAREEMLASVMVAAPNALPVLAPGRLMPVLMHGGAPWVVIDAAPRPEMSTGLPAFVDRTSVVVTRKDLDPNSTPEPVRALAGRAVQLYTAAGAGCRGVIRELAMIRRVDVHFGTESQWFDGDGGLRGDPTTLAQQAWELGESGALLAARVEPPPTGCNGSSWARVADLPALPVYTRRAAEAALATRALTRFRALAAWTRLQTAYAEDPGATRGANWDEHAGAQPMTGVWSAPGSARRWVVVVASAQVGGCAAFSGRLWAVFEVGGATGLTLHTSADDPGFFQPLAGTDMDADGVPEFVTPDGVVRRVDGTFRLVESVRYPNLDCEC